jgi:hypothetical protein
MGRPNLLAGRPRVGRIETLDVNDFTYLVVVSPVERLLLLGPGMRNRDRVHGPRESAARQHVTDPHPPEVRRKRGRPKGSTGISRRHPDSVLAAEIAKSPLATVYASHDGELYHSVCKQPLEFQGRRAQLEFDFYCLRCMEHVALPQFALSRIRFDLPRPADVELPEWAASIVAYQ